MNSTLVYIIILIELIEILGIVYFIHLDGISFYYFNMVTILEKSLYLFVVIRIYRIASSPTPEVNNLDIILVLITILVSISTSVLSRIYTRYVKNYHMAYIVLIGTFSHIALITVIFFITVFIL